MKTLRLKTFDDIDLAADYYPADKPAVAAVYVHMMPATKESWRGLAEYLAQNGVAGIAIDLRGHGQSTQGPDGYKQFKSEDHQQSRLDLLAAARFLRSLGLGFKADKIAFIGASIGANLSLQFVAGRHDYKAAILLSAGLNYHGVDAEALVKKLIPGQKVFFAACHDDIGSRGDNAVQNEKLFDETPAGVTKTKKIYETGGHGTNILGADPGLAEEILKFIADK